MMRRCAGLDADKARRQLLEEGNDVTSLQLAPDDHIAFGVNAMDLKNRLCEPLHRCLLPEAAAVSRWYRGLRVISLLVARARGAWAYRAPDATSLCQAVREAAQE